MIKIKLLLLSKNVYSKIINHVKEGYPYEVCGVLLGKRFNDICYATEAIKLKNIIKSPRRFWFNVKHWMKVIYQGKEKGLEYIGLYHSHPDSDIVPSLYDLERMVEAPGEVWLIIAYNPPDIRIKAWYIPDYYSRTVPIHLLIS